MNSPRETEIKLVLPAEAFPLVRRTLPGKSRHGGKAKELVSVYFDTDNFDLHKHRFSLRLRRDGRRYLQTIKTEDGQALGTRGEWEREVRSDTPDFRALRNTPAAKVLRMEKSPGKIKPIFETRVTRTSYPTKIGKSLIAVAFDQGEIDTGRQSTGLSEVELELKRGQLRDLFRLAKTIVQKAPVELAFTSKAERGYRLLSGDQLIPVKGAPVALNPDLTTGQAFQAIGRACLRQLVDNLPALRIGEPEALHQARVALRRLRAAISLFADVICDATTESIKNELTWIASEFGPAREMDVLLARADVTTKEAQALGPEAELDGLPALEDQITQRRRRAFCRARAAVESKRFRLLVIDFAAWIETGECVSSDEPLQQAKNEIPIQKFAAAELERRWKRILKRGRELRSLDPLRRHKLRIAVKKLRYATEFFVGAFPGHKANRRREVFLNRLKPLQDSLGELNDIMVNQHLTADLVGGPVRELGTHGVSSKAFAAGLLSGHEQARVDGVLAAAEKAFRRFTRIKPYW
jgi:triphosphatase